jgi:hypothetical protein
MQMDSTGIQNNLISKVGGVVDGAQMEIGADGELGGPKVDQI